MYALSHQNFFSGQFLCKPSAIHNIFLEYQMIKLLVIVCMTLTLAACGTVGGALSGAGQDLDKAGNWIKKQ